MKSETQMLIAKNIRTLRTSKCISQTDFAKLVGVSRSTYASYELGNRVPDAETLFLIAKKFGLNMNIFFECDHYKFLGYLESCEIFDEGTHGSYLQLQESLVFRKRHVDRAFCLSHGVG